MIRQIYPDFLFIGNAFDARDQRALYGRQIAAVVDLAANEPPAQLARDMIYYRIPILDGGGNLDRMLLMAVDAVVTLVSQQVPTLVACSAGMSRSPVIAAAAIAQLSSKSLDHCLAAIVEGAPHDISPILWSRVCLLHDRLPPPRRF